MTRPAVRQRRQATLALIVLLTLCVLAYLGSLSGGFLFDDFQNIANNAALRAIGTPSQSWLAVAFSSDSGFLRRPVSMLSFGLNVFFFGMNASAFKLVNLSIHLANGALIYAIGRYLAYRLISPSPIKTIKPETVALVAAGLWLLHPLNVSGVVYIVQRMNELAVFFTLAGLLAYVDGRVRMLQGERALGRAILGVCMFGLLAVLSKENGALISAYALVIEAVCFRFESPQPLEKQILKAFFWLTVALPLAAFAAYLAIHPHWLPSSYSVRDFTLYERVLSEARILCGYLMWIFVPAPAAMGLYHDDIAKSTSMFSPFSTVIAIVFLMALAISAWASRRRSPGFAFGVVWFAVGHAMESTILPLELVFEHRNYLPMAGLLLGTACAAAPWLASRWSASATALVSAVLIVICGGLTTVRAASWGDPLTLALADASHHPDSSRSQYEAGRAIVVAGAIRGERARADREAEPYYARSAMLDKTLIAPASELILIQADYGPVAKTSLDDLAERLRRATSYTQASPFLDMLTTVSLKKLSLTPADISTLVEVALANPHFPPKVRALIMNNYGAYQFNVAHDQQGAITWTSAAAAEEPQNAYFQLNLAKIALATGHPDKAREYLVAARQLDKIGIYGSEIADLQRQVVQ